MHNIIHLSSDLLKQVADFLDGGSLENLLLTLKAIFKNVPKDADARKRMRLHRFLEDKNNKDIKSLLTNFNKMYDSNDTDFKQYAKLIFGRLGADVVREFPFKYSSMDNVAQTIAIAIGNDTFVEIDRNLLKVYKFATDLEKIAILAANPNLVQYFQANAKSILKDCVDVSQLELYSSNPERYLQFLRSQMIILGVVVFGATSAFLSINSDNYIDIRCKFLLSSIIDAWFLDFAIRKINSVSNGSSKARMIFSKQMPEFTNANVEILKEKISRVNNKLHNA